jgi:hypothetical protein
MRVAQRQRIAGFGRGESQLWVGFHQGRDHRDQATSARDSRQRYMQSAEGRYADAGYKRATVEKDEESLSSSPTLASQL